MFQTTALYLALTASIAAVIQDAKTNTDEIDVPAFVAMMDRLASTVERAEPRDVTGILVSLPSRVQVRDGEHRFDIDLESIALDLANRSDEARWPARRDAAAARLAHFKTEAEGLLRARSRIRDADLRDALTAVLARREFTLRDAASWRMRLLQHLDDWFGRLLGRLIGSNIETRGITLALAWLATIAALAGITFWIYRTARRPAASRAGEMDGEHAEHTPAHQWARRALAAAQAGRTAEAVRSAYRAAVTRFEDQGVWRADRARTAREYVRLLTPDDIRREMFHDIARAFEMVVYASRTPAAEDVARVAHHLEALGCIEPHDRAI